MALPVDQGTAAGTGNTRRWYTISAELRETYDDNVNTTHTNQQVSLETSLTPSVLVDFPSDENHFSARYTLGLTYYENLNSGSSVNAGGNASQQTFNYTNELDAQYNHSFSERFNFTGADDFRYYTDPNIFESTGTNYQNGPYFVNTFSGTLTSQWTPLIGTTTTYSNSVVRYQDSGVALLQNSMENTGSQSVSFAILPKISLNVGAIIDDNSYESSSRGYTSYTGYGGISWQALPTLTMSGRAGATDTETAATTIAGQPPQSAQNQISPYASYDLSWNLGAKSILTFSYAHEITPTDQALGNGQSSDRVSTSFTYSITPNLSAHLQGIYTYADITSDLAATSAEAGYTENSYGIDTGMTYHYNTFLNFDFHYTYTGVTSAVEINDYARNQVSFGIRGTY